MPPRVAAIVLSYNGKEVTLQALASLTEMAYPAYDLVVVDNGSTDGTDEAVREAFPQVQRLRLTDNRGPARGVNAGIRWAMDRGYDYLLILNNDIEVAPDFLDRLVEVAEGDASIGCVGPMGYYYEDRRRIWSAGGKICFREAVTKERGQGQIDRGQFARDEEMGYVNGCAMLVRRQAVTAAGLWDPLFFLGIEDADFCMRVRQAGYRCYFAPRARLWHMVSRSTGGYRPGKTYQTGRGTAIFLRRWAKPWQWATALLFLAGSLPVAWLRELVLRRNQAAVVAKVRGLVDGLRQPLTRPPRLAGDEEAASGAR